MANPWREGAPEFPEAASLAQKGLWPVLRLYVPYDVFSVNLVFLFNANLESLHQEKWTIARKKI